MLKVIDASRRYRDRLAVDSLSFEVRGGEIFGLVGPNGAGKTTTLRMLGGLIPPTTGEIHINGTRVDASTSDHLRTIIGFLTETPGLWEQLTVLDNLLTYARLFGVADAAAACERELRTFGLWERRGDRAGLLSKGMKQKLALARALLHSPRILLLDEPTANLDPHTARDVRDLLVERRRAGCAIVVSTHNLDEIDRVADRVALISTRLIAAGEPAALRRDLFGPRLRVRLAAGARPEDYLATARQAGAREVDAAGDALSLVVDDPNASVPAVIAALARAGAPIREAFDERPTLEEVYLRLLQKEPRS